ncbi:MAG: S-layer homology domain-containing protein [Tissierellia bacterium]|nr:S-layer homology domain-containing protein [Tissierellia bacterium]
MKIRLKRTSLLALGFVLLYTLPTFAASGRIKVVDEAGRELYSITETGKDQQLINIRGNDRLRGETILYISNEQLILRDNNEDVVVVTVARGANREWNTSWYPYDYSNRQTWDISWYYYRFPEYKDTESYWNYSRAEYDRYVNHYNRLRSDYEVSKERSDWYKEGEVRSTKVFPKYIIGTEGSKFEPDRLLTRAEAASMFARLVAGDQKIGSQPIGYSDIKPNSWYRDVVGYASARGLAIAVPGEKFYPAEPISTDDFNKLLNKAVEVLGYSSSVELAKGLNVTRGEAVRLINLNTKRLPDHYYITEKIASPFVDVLSNTAMYDQLMTASTTYMQSTWNDGLVGWSYHTK